MRLARQHLAEAVVDLVRARVAEVLALEEEAHLAAGGGADLGDRRPASDSGVGRPTYSRNRRSSSAPNLASRVEASQAAVSSSRAGIRVSET
jgi:hypothetical protein